ncbi:hypothetical protein DFQ05_2213 [Winogradskyella wandonensis]|uniref:Uncharacterized protein n=1 Tax=Winogradskyella wandonensis TaxID=1442586 RepID=A0A4V2PT40_9FLAO|nr:hypothetical protein [Winogradskyella wandonensis]TCK65001.1 hypothetical protein DFQ05_2213 [Winogradskyella wandonensis]
MPSAYNTTERLQLGEVGEDKNFLLEKDYSHTAIPIYEEHIKVNVQSQEFSRASYNLFLKSKEKQHHSVKVDYTDSLKVKPRYLELSIADRVSVINSIMSNENTGVDNYLLNKPDAHLISSISIVFTNEQQNRIQEADEVFVKSFGVKSYALYLYRKGVLIDTIPFSNGVVFKYSTSNFCWKQEGYSAWSIVDIVENDESCPKGTYRSPKKEKSLNQYLRF